MPQVHIQRPEAHNENVKLSVEKLKSIFLVGQSDEGEVKIYLDGNAEFKSIQISPNVLNQSVQQLEQNIATALTNAINATKKVKRAEVRGRLTLKAQQEKLWDIIDTVIA